MTEQEIERAKGMANMAPQCVPNEVEIKFQDRPHDTGIPMPIALAFVVLFCVLMVYEMRDARQAGWEDGVFWGAAARDDDATATSLLARAYQLRSAANKRVLENEEKLKQLRKTK
jgi:hypothetical protein